MNSSMKLSIQWFLPSHVAADPTPATAALVTYPVQVETTLRSRMFSVSDFNDASPGAVSTLAFRSLATTMSWGLCLFHPVLRPPQAKSSRMPGFVARDRLTRLRIAIYSALFVLLDCRHCVPRAT